MLQAKFGMQMNLSLEEIRNFSVALSAIVATLIFLKGIIEYTKRSVQDRAEKFHDLRKQFKSNSSIRKLLPLLEDDSEDLRGVPFSEKLEFLGFYEDLALMYRSKLIKKHVVHYMFAYYAIRCWESENFWMDICRDSVYWALFNWFVEEMQSVEKSFSFNIRKYKL